MEGARRLQAGKEHGGTEFDATPYGQIRFIINGTGEYRPLKVGTGGSAVPGSEGDILVVLHSLRRRDLGVTDPGAGDSAVPD